MDRSKRLFVSVYVFGLHSSCFRLLSPTLQRVIENPKPEQNIRLHEREPVKGQALKTAKTKKVSWKSHPSLEKTGRGVWGGGGRERIHVPHTNSSTVENSEVFRTRSPFNSSRNPKPKTWELSVIACHPSGPHPPPPLPPSPSLPPSSFPVSGSQKIGYCVENYYMDPFASSLYSGAILDTRLRAVSACSRTGGWNFAGTFAFASLV